MNGKIQCFFVVLKHIFVIFFIYTYIYIQYIYIQYINNIYIYTYIYIYIYHVPGFLSDLCFLQKMSAEGYTEPCPNI